MKYVVDTHALIWFLEGNLKLGSDAKNILSAPTSELIIPATALSEAVWIVERGRTSIPSADTLLKVITTDPRAVIYPLDTSVIARTITLSQITEMHDRQIVATALFIESRGDKVALLTCDQNITASGLVTIIW
ncbi:PIN domain-containing protein [Aetokthonos hydrillicola Thurmond2011]|jgi:PIN domain nuclease of toxin-antitoxin system|uniref:PIN domain-containing protein n=1 Tax=Aetokthonos hydrillicola Thurmond2011 TaxID=2712845 RepID=A0AAP5IGU3_9CYAN|nr:PIN domain-containing protein [Aetokthonos hydrillicola]MBO3461912.1 type II toxin-antitoxin system VapC family toxin [Aetokthonos hydrillicola CCALA 1050]MBW4585423.1 PIN domain-containing protein [Aetokthonos hydrillicola CCALA 1050]MDR9899070.1 PIN domain-containing protein [Aetokthonos hydrillicola Thurmond2011]